MGGLWPIPNTAMPPPLLGSFIFAPLYFILLPKVLCTITDTVNQ